jgi:hypothetical protein
MVEYEVSVGRFSALPMLVRDKWPENATAKISKSQKGKRSKCKISKAKKCITSENTLAAKTTMKRRKHVPSLTLIERTRD